MLFHETFMCMSSSLYISFDIIKCLFYVEILTLNNIIYSVPPNNNQNLSSSSFCCCCCFCHCCYWLMTKRSETNQNVFFFKRKPQWVCLAANNVKSKGNFAFFHFHGGTTKTVRKWNGENCLDKINIWEIFRVTVFFFLLLFSAISWCEWSRLLPRITNMFF